MSEKKLNLIQRAQVALTGSYKGFIPPLPNDTSFGTDVPLATYATKADQLRANLGWVYAANSAIVDEVSSVPLKLYRRNKKGEREEVVEHEILELLENPSSAFDGETMRNLIHTYRNLVGESYVLMMRDGNPFEVKPGKLPHALHVLPAHEVDFKLNTDGAYSESKVKHGRETYTLTEVIRSFKPNPFDIYRGRSIVSAAAAAIDTDEQMQSWNRRMFANNGRPGLIFNLTGENIDAEVYERLKQQVQELYSQDGVFRSLVVQNGEVKPYMLNQQDLDFLNSREFTREEILAMFKLPSSVLGMSKDYNRANIDGSRYINSLINIVPRLRDEVRMWNNALVKPYDDTLELDFENPTPEDIESKLKEASQGVDSWLTIDEVRALYGKEELEDGTGAQLYRPINTVPITSLTPATKPAAGAEGKKSHPKHAA